MTLYRKGNRQRFPFFVAFRCRYCLVPEMASFGTKLSLLSRLVPEMAFFGTKLSFAVLFCPRNGLFWHQMEYFFLREALFGGVLFLGGEKMSSWAQNCPYVFPSCRNFALEEHFALVVFRQVILSLCVGGFVVFLQENNSCMFTVLFMLQVNGETSPTQIHTLIC